MRRSSSKTKQDTPQPTEQALQQLLEKLETIKPERDSIPYAVFAEKKCVLYLIFAEAQPADVDPELAEYLSQLRTDAALLAAQCAGVIRSGYPVGALTNVQDVIDEDNELSGLLENICLIVKPERLEALNAAV